MHRIQIRNSCHKNLVMVLAFTSLRGVRGPHIINILLRAGLARSDLYFLPLARKASLYAFATIHIPDRMDISSLDLSNSVVFVETHDQQPSHLSSGSPPLWY